MLGTLVFPFFTLPFHNCHILVNLKWLYTELKPNFNCIFFWGAKLIPIGEEPVSLLTCLKESGWFAMLVSPLAAKSRQNWCERIYHKFMIKFILLESMSVGQSQRVKSEDLKFSLWKEQFRARYKWSCQV